MRESLYATVVIIDEAVGRLSSSVTGSSRRMDNGEKVVLDEVILLVPKALSSAPLGFALDAGKLYQICILACVNISTLDPLTLAVSLMSFTLIVKIKLR